MNNKGSGQKTDLLAVLLILCIFSVAILSVLLTGAGSYKNITERDRASQKDQIEVLYISNKLFQAESAESVHIDADSGIDILSIDSFEGGQPHITRVYCYDGWLRELYSDAQYDFDPSDGEKLARMDNLEFDLQDGLLTVDIQSEGASLTKYFDLKGADNEE